MATGTRSQIRLTPEETDKLVKKLTKKEKQWAEEKRRMEAEIRELQKQILQAPRNPPESAEEIPTAKPESTPTPTVTLR
ncbi:hypothetical protein M0802_011942 [Mischocyttarus mexicanus]|nr:hypothetical protein M0802_011942 [Mischocyttarus mexicanus]